MNATRSRTRWLIVGGGVLVVAGLAAGIWSFSGKGGMRGGPTTLLASEGKGAGAIKVETVQPLPGGVQRRCTQPGTVEPFESAELYAKASGFLAEQGVDIGSRVKKGDVLAKISVPESEKQVQRDTARVKDAQAKEKQMQAHLAASRAEAKAAEASVKSAQVLVRAKTAYRQYREKYSNRIKELVKKEAMEGRVADEQEDNYLAALEGENAAKEAVIAAQERASAASARIDQATADLEEAAAGVEVARADLERSQVLLDYCVVKSPYTGVVTRRSFHLGDFVKSADQGGTTPLFTVERTDVMRVVIQVPDRDVPYVAKGAPALVEIDALPGVVYRTSSDSHVEVARWADSEDPATRTMRTEVDVKNTDGKLRHGMYGKATLILGNGTADSLRIPSSALVGKAENGHGSVRVVREGKAHQVPVSYASDNAVEVEILSGLQLTDELIVRAAGALEEGTPVTAAPASGGH